MRDNYSVYDTLPCAAAVFLINEKLDIVYSNDLYKGKFKSEYIDIYNHDKERFVKLAKLADNAESIRFRIFDINGERIFARFFIKKLTDECVLCVAVDESDAEMYLSRLYTERAMFAAAMRGTDEIFYEYDANKDILTIFSNNEENSENITTRAINNVLEKNHIYKFFTKEDCENVKALFQSDIQKEMTTEIRIRLTGSNAYEWFSCVIRPLARKGIFVGTIRNINKRKLEEDALKAKATIDPLTKVFNRHAAIERINEKIAGTSEYSQHALIVLDLDNFKKINDTFGHLYGDAVISMAAGNIKNTLGDEDIIGRFGGDEFFVYIDNAERGPLESKLENIRQSILKMRRDQNDNDDISCSIGVALSEENSTYDEMFRQADSALYIAKEKGKNRYEYFSGRYIEDGGCGYAGRNGVDDDESNTAHNVVTMALEIASKSNNAENAIINIMRHAGTTLDLSAIQVFKFDTVDDVVYLEFQWYKEHNGVFNCVDAAEKMGYYVHDDLLIFQNRFTKERVFQYTPDFKEGFSVKYRDAFIKMENDGNNMLFACNTEMDKVFYVIAFQSKDIDRVWDENELKDISEITRIISVYLKSSYVTTDREKSLVQKLDYDEYGTYTYNKFYDEAGRIGREARMRKEKLAFINVDFLDLNGFNKTYGRNEGKRVLKDFSEFLLSQDKTKLVSSYLRGTDKFIIVVRYSDGEDIRAEMEKMFDEFCKNEGDYSEFPLIIKAGLCRFVPGEYVIDASCNAETVKKGKRPDKTTCYAVDNVPLLW